MPGTDNILQIYDFLKTERTVAFVQQEFHKRAADRPMLSMIFSGAKVGDDDTFVRQMPGATLRFHWDERIGARGKAKPVVVGAGPVKRGYARYKERAADMISINLVKPVNMQSLMDMRRPGTMDTVDFGMDWMRREVRDLLKEGLNTLEYACWEGCHQGSISYGIANQAEYGPAGSYSLNLLSQVANTAPWGEPTTDIFNDEIPIRIRKAYYNQCGQEPGMALCSETVKAAVWNNLLIQEIYKNNPNPAMVPVAITDNAERFTINRLRFLNSGWIGTKEDGDSTVTEFNKFGGRDDILLIFPPDEQRVENFKIYSHAIKVPTGWGQLTEQPPGPVLYVLQDDKSKVWEWHFEWYFAVVILSPDLYMRYETKAHEVPTP